MALKKLVSDLTEGLVAYPNHNTPSDSGGFNYGSSTSVFDTKTFNQRGLFYTNFNTRQENPAPLIPQLLPGVNQEPESSILYLDDAPDGFIRGGVDNALKRAAYDTIRINRFFKTGEGITFISNQKALQKSNPVIQEGGGNLNNVFEDVLSLATGVTFTSANTNRTFNEGNLIKQVSEGGYTGNYYNRAGSNPEIQSRDENKYEQIHRIGRKFDANLMGTFSSTAGLESGNRLLTLGKKLKVGYGNSFNIATQTSLFEQGTNLGFDIGTIVDQFGVVSRGLSDLFNDPLSALSQPGEFSEDQNIGFKPGENIIYQFSGGPGSTYGIGNTILYRYERTSGDYDHQGHPLSIEKYFKIKGHTINPPQNINFFNEDGSFNNNAGLNALANIANENLFGGNNILGENGLIFGDNFVPNSMNDIIQGVGNQLFGNDTVNFLGSLFSGDTIGSKGNTTTVKIKSYKVGDIQDITGAISKDSVIVGVGGVLDGSPKPGYIKSKQITNNNHSGSLMAGSNKPDDLIDTLNLTTIQRKGLASNRRILFNPTNPYYYAPEDLPTNRPSTTNVYRPDNSSISLEGRLRTDEAVQLSNLQSGKYEGNHYYTKKLNNPVKNKIDGNRNYTQESRIGKGNPGGFFEGKNNNVYLSVNNLESRIDKINALDIHENTSLFDNNLYRDLIRFRFEAMQTNDPETVDVMAFRAFLDDYADNYNADWNSFKYNGRGEDFYTYGGFKRDVSFNFKVAAQTRAEMKPLYRKLNFLCTTLAPDYSSTGRMRGSFIRMTIGSLLDRVPGFLTSINLSWQKDYPFEIALSEPEGGETKMHALPHVLDVSCNFTPIHDFVPRKSINNSPFFGTTGGDDRGWYSNSSFSSAQAAAREGWGSTSSTTSTTSTSNNVEGDGVTIVTDHDDSYDYKREDAGGGVFRYFTRSKGGIFFEVFEGQKGYNSIKGVFGD